MSKVMKILLSVTTIVLIMALWVGCGSTATNSSTSGNSQTSSSSTTNTNSTVQQTSNPSDTQQPQPGERPAGTDNSQMNAVASRAAEILNIPEEEFLAAFQSVMSSHMPSSSGSNQQPPQGGPPEQGEPMQQPPEHPDGEAPEMQPGQQGGQGPGFNMEEIYAELAGILGNSADDIASAFQQAQQELSK